MTVGAWVYLAVVVVLCSIAPAAWVRRTYRQWRRDLRNVRMYREAVQTPEGQRLYRQMLACRDAYRLRAYDAEMEHHLNQGRS